jgi:SAM-dependent methyltransferase
MGALGVILTKPVSGYSSRDISGRLLSALACPYCHAALEVEAGSAVCESCGMHFPRNDGGQLDLRLRFPKKYSIDFSVGGPISPPRASGESIPLNPHPQIDPDAIRLPRELVVGNRLSRSLLSYFPRAVNGGLMLYLGCGTQPFKDVCASTNLEYVGIDYSGAAPPLLGDAHALPFADDSFEFAVSFAVLEHLHNPFVAMREVCRVLKPGALFIGTVAFLEPFHMNSCFHQTHLGTQQVLESAGLEIVFLEPNAEWNGLLAQAWMSLFPHAPLPLAKMLVWPVVMAHRMWWTIGNLLRRSSRTSEACRRLSTAGGFRFVCRKPIVQ